MDTVQDITHITEDTLKGFSNKPALYGLVDGGEVIGHMVDAQNRLIYIIRTQGTITADYGVNRRPIATQRPQQKVVRVVDVLTGKDKAGH